MAQTKQNCTTEYQYYEDLGADIYWLLYEVFSYKQEMNTWKYFVVKNKTQCY